MTKADIVNEIAKNTGIEKVTVQKTVEAFMESVKDSMVTGNNVYLRGFGKQPGTSPRTQPLLFLHITFRHSNQPKHSSLKLNPTLRNKKDAKRKKEKEA